MGGSCGQQGGQAFDAGPGKQLFDTAPSTIHLELGDDRIQAPAPAGKR